METIDQVLEEMAQFVNDSIATHAFATMGLRQLSISLGGMARTPENPDPQIFIGNGNPNLPETQTYAGWRLSKALEEIVPHGPVDMRLGRQWLVSMFAAWEHDFRQRLAVAHGVEHDSIVVPLFGDLRLLRHDVLHCRGIATSDHAGRCQLLRWFQVGDEIQIRGDHHLDFVAQIPWDKMRAGPNAS